MSTTRQEIAALVAATRKYELLDENKEGANAYAFRARHLPLNQHVFLKVYDADPDGDLFAEPRLLVEATNGEAGDSNLVRVHDAERLGDEYVLVAMEYVDGGSILARLGTGPLPLMEAITAAIGILHGVAKLHQGLLVHRDLKPANILLSRRHGRVWPKITDFGSVARLSDPRAAVTASRHSALYVPPEGWQAPSVFDVRSDLYQVGLVLSEMVHGSLPYDGAAYLDREAQREIRTAGATTLEDVEWFERCQIVNRALERAARSARILRPGPSQPYAPNSVSRIINKATACEPDARYQTASEMIGDLEALHLPDWRPSSTPEDYQATAWDGWDWSVTKDPKNARQWVVLRAREQTGNYRRWSTAQSARAACRLVSEVAG